MRQEHFQTQARLLASSRMDGQRAHAQDTDNTFVWVGGFGWQQLVPVDSIAGQPLVAATDRGLAAYDTHNRLIPSGGAAGQLAGVSQDGETTIETHQNSPSVTLPLDFSDGASHTWLNRSIPGGKIGPNGWLRVTALIQIVTNAARTLTVTLASQAITGASMTSSASTYVVKFTALGLAGGTVPASGLVWIVNLRTSRWAGAATAILVDDTELLSSHSIDTGNDWTLSATLQASGAITGTATVGWVLVEYGYIA